MKISTRRFASLIVALLLAVLAVPASSAASVVTFSNATPITIPDQGNASPYPSTIAVDGLTGPVQKATVALQGFSHTCPNDVSTLLVAPSGARSILFAHLGPGQACPPSSNANLTFDDAATASVPYPPVTGTYKPTDGEPGLANFGAPAPPPPYPVALSSFVGVAPSGTWSLYVNDDGAGDSGSIAQGWSLTLNAVSSTFEFGKLRRNKKRGTATLVVEVPDPGTLTLRGKGLVKQRVARASRATASKTVSAAGKVKLKITAKGKAKRKLNSTGKVRVKANVTFTPTGGIPNTQKKKLTLKKRL